MIDHTGFSVTHLEDSKRFYTRILASLGHIIRREFPDAAVGFGPAEADEGADPGGGFWITQGTPSTPRMHLAFSAKTKNKWMLSTVLPSKLGVKIMARRDTGRSITLGITPRLFLTLMATILKRFSTSQTNDSRHHSATSE